MIMVMLGNQIFTGIFGRFSSFATSSIRVLSESLEERGRFYTLIL